MNNICKFNLKNNFSSRDLSCCLLKKFGKNMPIVVCLGSDKVLSDMVGVLVADKLKQKNIPLKVFGGSKLPIGGNNLDFLLKNLSSKNILFVDSVLTNFVGNVYFSPKGITLKNGRQYAGASIGAGTIFLKNNRVLLAQTSYVEVLMFANTIVDAICNYVYFAKLLNNCK